jgi:anti-anti-sigma factor
MIDIKTVDKTLTCSIRVEIVASKIPEMRDLLFSQLDRDLSWENLVLDCHLVTTLDSIGVNFLVSVFKKMESEGKSFRVIGCNETVTKVLKLFRLEEKFVIESV